LALEHKDFINGKKNGKINKIIKTAGCKITFQESFNDYNMLIDLYQSVPPRALEGLTLLEDELPAEISFHVPETFHKRIIGVGGKNIQRIMKQYGVYVKFSNTQEHNSIGGYFELEDNVIARTPSKNQENLQNLKQTIMDILEDEHQQPRIASDWLYIPRHHQSRVLGFCHEDIQKIEMNTSTNVEFPDVHKACNRIQITGSVGNLNKAKSMIQVLHFNFF
jgi:hypothetical protein